MSGEWDERALSYPMNFDRQSVSVAVDLASRLEERGSIIDIGCGPGTHSIPFSRIFDDVFAVDSSPAMLERLSTWSMDNGLTNIHAIQSDCSSLGSDMKYDLVFTCLCPGMYSLGSALMMERISSGYCMFIGPLYDEFSPERRILSSSGVEYVPVFDTRAILAGLSEMGREVESLSFSERHNYPDKGNLISRCLRLSSGCDDDRSRIERYVDSLDQIPEERALMCLLWRPKL